MTKKTPKKSVEEEIKAQIEGAEPVTEALEAAVEAKDEAEPVVADEEEPEAEVEQLEAFPASRLEELNRVKLYHQGVVEDKKEALVKAKSKVGAAQRDLREAEEMLERVEGIIADESDLANTTDGRVTPLPENPVVEFPYTVSYYGQDPFAATFGENTRLYEFIAQALKRQDIGRPVEEFVIHSVNDGGETGVALDVQSVACDYEPGSQFVVLKLDEASEAVEAEPAPEPEAEEVEGELVPEDVMGIADELAGLPPASDENTAGIPI
jgi:hypothetical protein